MIKYVVVRGEEVIRYGNCQPETLVMQAADGETVLTVEDFIYNCWWDPVEEVFVQQTDLPVVVSGSTVTADGLDSIEITGAPIGALVTIRDSLGVSEAEVESSDPIVITTDVPGLLLVNVRHYKHLPFEVVVEAV